MGDAIRWKINSDANARRWDDSKVRDGNGGFAPPAVHDAHPDTIRCVGNFDLKIAEAIGTRLEVAFAKLVTYQLAGNSAQQLILNTLREIVERTVGGACGSSGASLGGINGAVLRRGR